MNNLSREELLEIKSIIVSFYYDINLVKEVNLSLISKIELLIDGLKEPLEHKASLLEHKNNES